MGRIPPPVFLAALPVLLLACDGRMHSLGRPHTHYDAGDGGEDNGSGGTTGFGGGVLGGRSGVGGTSVGGKGGAVSQGGSSGDSTSGGTSGDAGASGSAGEPGCGDGVAEPPEQCDDGNAVRGDGCSDACRWEAVALTAGGSHSCALGANGVVKCWGGNGNAQLGVGDSLPRGIQPGEMGDELEALSLGTGGKATAIGAGFVHTCALLDEGSIKCWGSNAMGQLGQGDGDSRGDDLGEMGDALLSVNLGTGRTARSLSVNWHYTCALLDDGSVKCWGSNQLGSLGLGDRSNRGDEPGEMGDELPILDLGNGRMARIISGDCALLDDDALKCWGFNAMGQLGLGDAENRGDEPNEMGDLLPGVNLGTGRTARSVAQTWRHACAVLDDGAVKCWGENAYGELGLGDQYNRGDEPNEMGDALAPVDLGQGHSAIAVAGRLNGTCAVLETRQVKCWGTNFAGQLGLGDTDHRGDDPNEMGNALATVDLGTGRTVRALALGWDHACALLDDGTVKCWGYNGDGELGLGDTDDRGDEPGEMGDNLPAVELGF